MFPGYAGKIGHIDLTAKKIRVETLEEEIVRKYVGRKGLGAYFLYKYFKVEWFISCLSRHLPSFHLGLLYFGR